MEIMSIVYFYELCKNMNMTKTAQRLYMTQQTLSNHIIKLEEIYKTKLFYRKPKLKLTPSGEVFLEYAKKVLEEEKNIKDRISDIEEELTGTIILGASSPRCNSYIPQVLAEFSRKYPLIKIKLIDEYSAILEKLVLENEIDFAISVDQTLKSLDIITEKIIDDKVFFLVSDILLKKYYSKKIEKLKEENFNGVLLKNFKKLPFLTISSTNRLGKIVEACFKENNFIPNSYLETKYTSMLVPLCNSGLIAGFTSQMNLTSWKKELEEHVNIFPLHNKKGQVTISINLIRNKNRYLPKYTLFFIELLKKYLRILEFTDLSKKVKKF